MEHNRSTNPVATALRDAGFIPLPRLWVKPEDIDEIISIATKHRDEVCAIKHGSSYSHASQADNKAKPLSPSPTESAEKKNPQHDIEAAWAAYEQTRNAL